MICEDGAFAPSRLRRRSDSQLAARKEPRGGFLRGASTISMKLAKNLFLSRENAVAKLQEAVSTIAARAGCRDEILELF